MKKFEISFVICMITFPSLAMMKGSGAGAEKGGGREAVVARAGSNMLTFLAQFMIHIGHSLLAVVEGDDDSSRSAAGSTPSAALSASPGLRRTPIAGMGTPEGAIRRDIVASASLSGASLPTGRGFMLTPSSVDRHDVIYIISPYRLELEAVDLRYRRVTEAELLGLAADVIAEVGRIGEEHRYVGRTSDRGGVRARFSAHARDMNAKEFARLQRAVREHVEADEMVFNQVIVYNVHADQIAAIEAFFIRLFRANGPGGLNSDAGHSAALEEFKKYDGSEAGGGGGGAGGGRSAQVVRRAIALPPPVASKKALEKENDQGKGRGKRRKKGG